MWETILKERLFNMQGVFEVRKNEQCDYDIECNIISKYAQNKIPEEQEKLYIYVEQFTSIIKSLNMTNKGIKNEYFNKVISIAQSGLTGPNAQPILAMKSLDSLKEEIVINEGGRIKNSYMIYLGIVALAIILIGTVLVWIFNRYKFYLFNKYIFVFQGSMIGAWISFGARKVELKFEELSIIENDRLNPIIRLIFIGISSVVLLLFINSEIITFSVGGFKSENICNSIESQVLIGVIAGLLEYKVSIGIFNKASNIIDL
ncbi:hypothetical protein FDF33_14810 [Clostridium botulinum]|nr:hypothetical protein [Clostridium botulinum]